MRNRYLDLLRAVAILRVVVYHVTGWSLLTVLVPAMPVMFALAGSLMAASLDRGGRLGLAAVARRLRRLLPSLWVLVAVFVPAMLLTGLAWDPKVLLWLLPLQDPPANGWGSQVLSANWYLRDFLWFVLLSPAALALFRRAPWPAVAVPYLMLLAIEFGGWHPPVVVRDIGLYFGAWMLGFAHHDGLLRRLAPRRLLTLAGGLAVGGLAWALTHPGPRGYDLNDIPLANALWAAGFILVAFGLAPQAEARLRLSARWDRVVSVLNARALTIYLWHVPAIVGVTRLAETRGWPVLGAAGTTWRLAAVAAAVAVVVALVGWVEDVAGRRRPTLLPGGRRAAATQDTAGVRATAHPRRADHPAGRAARPVPPGSVAAGAVPGGSVPAGSVAAGAVPGGAVPGGAVPGGGGPAGAGRGHAEAVSAAVVPQPHGTGGHVVHAGAPAGQDPSPPAAPDRPYLALPALVDLAAARPAGRRPAARAERTAPRRTRRRRAPST